MTAPLEMVAFNTSRIYLMIYLMDITNIAKHADQKFKFLFKMIGCEAQEGAEQTINSLIALVVVMSVCSSLISYKF